MMKRTIAALLATLLLVALAAACGGSAGPEGPVGPAGPAGPQGPAGPPGENASARRDYVGSERCAECHETEYGKFVLSGHPYPLTAVNGQAPEYPYDSITGGVKAPPEGYSWDEIAYVIGGYRWNALFIDQMGYLVTGGEDSSTQLNFANDDLGTQKEWVAYHPGQSELLYDCGACHTTGYRTEGRQGDLEGIVGTWEMEGVQCEACHGPGSLHASDPMGYQMTIDRSSQACGQCHTRDNPAVIQAADGFGLHYQQYNELFNSKHFALTCVTCHDPHASTAYADPDVNPEAGFTQNCESCHWQYTERKVSQHGALFPACTSCHMPPLDMAATGNLGSYSGDVRAHLFAINVDPNAPQFSEDGTQVMPYLTVPYVCGQCHNDQAFGALELETLFQFATDYHSPTAGDGQ